MIMTVFRAATLRTFFFAFHAGSKELRDFNIILTFDNNMNLLTYCKVSWCYHHKPLVAQWQASVFSRS